MSELLEENYTYKDILTLTNFIYGFVQKKLCWFKEYINTVTLKSGLNKCKTYNFIIYRVNELRTSIFIVYLYSIKMSSMYC